VTLNMTIVAPWGIWQCSDHRVTDLQQDARTKIWKVTGTRDHSMKSIEVRCHDGAAVITYCGLGKLHPKSDDDISDWVRRLIRNENRTVDQTLAHICDGATRQLALPARSVETEHTFSVGAFVRGLPKVVTITNSPLAPSGRIPLQHFEIRPFPSSEPLVTGSGGMRSLRRTERC
jgi:hypothetical protein